MLLQQDQQGQQGLGQGLGGEGVAGPGAVGGMARVVPPLLEPVRIEILVRAADPVQ